MPAGRTKTRRDSKHRVLRRGESIRADGKYQFKYHINGKPHFVYSWRLEPTDKLPVGKKPCLSLRELEKQIGYDLDTRYLAGCIANALMEKEVSVCMTNFALILNDLAASYKDRNDYISSLCSFPLLILDDFGMERGTEYGLEQVYNVIDSRYRSRKPLIVTTNLTLEELQNPEDTAHARIYDRLIEMCTPVCITGENFRKARAREKMEQLKTLLNRKESL